MTRARGLALPGFGARGRKRPGIWRSHLEVIRRAEKFTNHSFIVARKKKSWHYLSRGLQMQGKNKIDAVTRPTHHPHATQYRPPLCSFFSLFCAPVSFLPLSLQFFFFPPPFHDPSCPCSHPLGAQEDCLCL